MASYPTDLSIQESEYFNWHCVICLKLALSPLTLEMQHITYDSVVYSDVNNDKWVKCDDCMSPFHQHSKANPCPSSYALEEGQ